MSALATAARRMSTMDSYFQEVNETSLLSTEDEKELAWRIQDGDSEARDQMVRANLRLVVSIARRFMGRGLVLQDLIQEGNLGLVHAVERFDPEQGTRFSTYAKFWIRDAIMRAVEKMSAPVRVPGYANDLMLRWRRAARDLHETLGRQPSDEEIGGNLHLSRRQMTIVQKALRIHDGVPHFGVDENSGLGAETVVDHGESPDARLEASDEMQHVLKLLDRLPSRAAEVLRLRFGLGGENPMALHEIGQKLDLTRERVRQIERDALARLRNLVEDAA